MCAAFVVFGHLGLVDYGVLGKPSSGTERLLYGALGSLFNGPAAVILFFIISGFCIHYPFLGDRALSLPSYFTRRLLRVCLPAIAFMTYEVFVLKSTLLPQDTVLWSVICEVIYYLIYPILRIFHRYTGWVPLIVSTYVIAFTLGIANHATLAREQNSYTALGIRGTWLIGLPCWLLGCWLAENYQSFKLRSSRQMWILRSFVFAVLVVIRIAKFHAHSVLARNCFTLDLFAILGCVWVGYEIVYLSHNGPLRSLEWGGKWSYSIYLVHTLVPPTLLIIGYENLPKVLRVTTLPVLLVVLAASYAFFLSIENPSHHLAKRGSRAFSRKTTNIPQVTMTDV